MRSPALTVNATEMFAEAITSLFSVVPRATERQAETRLWATEPGRLPSWPGLHHEHGPPCRPPRGRDARGDGTRSLTSGPPG